MRGYNVLYVYRRTTNANEYDDDDDEIQLTTVAFVRPVATVVVSVTDPACWYTEA